MVKEESRFVSWTASNRAQWTHYRWLSVITGILFVVAVFLMIDKPIVLTIMLVAVYLGGTHLLGAHYVRKQEAEQRTVDGPEH